jgi:hypothetical protein
VKHHGLKASCRGKSNRNQPAAGLVDAAWMWLKEREV